MRVAQLRRCDVDAEELGLRVGFVIRQRIGADTAANIQNPLWFEIRKTNLQHVRHGVGHRTALGIVQRAAEYG